ncbi:MAG TPA: LPS export ABC transporter periplasmic protein LptC [Methylotenera sp.]|jgi:lipopolysaccharide export system protein LptC|nr:LPS export ABC transporter periplasmic protein LptC [Methylotenera sp.]HPV31268.1 LPS export ABC transporter periplasmic protein LptC [Methylotenera sp.]
MITKARSAIVFPITLLAILAILAAWINLIVQPPTPKPDGSSRHDPDYIVNNFVTTQTDINGKLRYTLAASEMKHFPDNDATELKQPRYTQYTIDKPYTRVEGQRGDVSSNGEEVKLYDQVKVTREAFAEKGEMTVETDYLEILPNQNLVRTDRPVIIRQAPKTVIHATGMIYEKDKNTVTLLHKVKAHYERPPLKKSKVKKSTTNKQIQQPIAENTPKTKLNKNNGVKSTSAQKTTTKPVSLKSNAKNTDSKKATNKQVTTTKAKPETKNNKKLAANNIKSNVKTSDVKKTKSAQSSATKTSTKSTSATKLSQPKSNQSKINAKEKRASEKL